MIAIFGACFSPRELLIDAGPRPNPNGVQQQRCSRKRGRRSSWGVGAESGSAHGGELEAGRGGAGRAGHRRSWSRWLVEAGPGGRAAGARAGAGDGGERASVVYVV